jgi:predicted nucleic-acid-binding Zn-ribbon protein
MADPTLPLLQLLLNKWRGETDEGKDRGEEASEAVEWVRRKWGDEKPCPYCGSVEYAVGPPNSFLTYEGQPTTPFIPVTCRNCGQTAFIDLRIIDDDSSDAAQQK